MLYLPTNVISQQLNDLDFVLKEKNSSENDQINTNQVSNNTRVISETKYIGMGLIRGYQLYISSQDKPSCIFTLSCSHFGMEAVKYRGFFMGSLLIADRLTRCNDLARHYYQTDPNTQKAIDTVPYFEFKKSRGK